MAKNLLVSALLITVFRGVLSQGESHSSTAWTKWKVEHGRQYPSKDDEVIAWNIWNRNKFVVDEHNRAFDEGRQSFKLALNEFADQSHSEFRSKFHLKRKQPNLTGAYERRPSSSSSSSAIPASWDWRKEGKVNPVKNQGQFGSAAPIDVADAVASYSAIFGRTNLYELSVQEVIDCCLPYPIVDAHAFDCIDAHGGLCEEGSYHSATGSNPCNNASCKAVAQCNKGRLVQSGNETDLAIAVYSTPVVVAVDAGQPSFQLYQSGVYSDPSCSSVQLDHVLLLVGYGVTSDGTEYWICRNSWGESWGENGYINIARNQKNMCGIATDAIYPSPK